MFVHTHIPAAGQASSRLPRTLLLLIACAYVAGLGMLYLPQLGGVFDISIYKGIATRATEAISGGPAQIGSEYPPLATTLFLLAYVNPLQFSFPVAWMLLIVGSVFLASAYAACVLRDQQSWMIPAAVAGTIFLAGPEVVFGRYDVFVGLTLLLCLRARACRRFGHAGALLGVATALKFVPVLCVPILLATAPRRQWKSIIVGLGIGFGLSVAVPVAVMGAELSMQNFQHAIAYHSDREVQLESSWSGVHMLLKYLVGQRAQIGMSHLSVINANLGQWILPIAKPMIIIMAVGLSALAIRFRRRAFAHADTLVIAVLLFSLALSPVFSPQYVVWVLPLLLTWFVARFDARLPWRSLLVSAVLIGIVGLATQWVFPLHYDRVIDQAPEALIALNLRNAAVLILAIFLCREVFGSATRTSPARSPTTAFALLAFEGALLIAAIALLGHYNQRIAPRFLPATYRLPDGTHGAAGVPVSVDAPEHEPIDVIIPMFLANVPKSGKLMMKPDDCLETVSVNGHDVPDSAFCGDARPVDASGLLVQGRNLIAARVRNEAGAAGIAVMSGSLDAFSLAVAASFVAALALFFFGCYEAIVAACYHAAASGWPRSPIATGVSINPLPRARIGTST